MKEQETINESKLIHLLKVLTNKEMRSLSEFVLSPFFNKKEKIIQLFGYLKKYHPGFKPIYRTTLYEYLFPENSRINDEPLNNKEWKQLRDEMSELVKLVQDFLLYEQQKKNEVHQKYQLARLFLSRGLQKHVPSLLKTAKEKHALRPEGDPQHLYDMSLIAEVELFYGLTQDWGKPIGMQAAIDYFHYHALAGQLRLYAAAKSREHTMPFEYNYLMEKELLEHFSTQDYTHVPIVNAYYRIFMLFRGEDLETHYTPLIQMLTTQSGCFSYNELQNLYALLFNFCNLQINRGFFEYNIQKFEIYEHTLPEELWHYGKYISRDHFILAIRAGLGSNNIETTTSIIEQYGDELPPEHKKSIRQLARIFLLFAQKKYTASHDMLIKMGNPPEGFYYGLYYRILKMQIYYNLIVSDKGEYSGLLKYEIDNLRGYLKRAPMSKRNKASYKRFLNIITRIYDKQHSNRVKIPSAKVLQSIRDAIEDPNELLVERQWLLEKITEIEDYWNGKR